MEKNSSFTGNVIASSKDKDATIDKEADAKLKADLSQQISK